MALAIDTFSKKGVTMYMKLYHVLLWLIIQAIRLAAILRFGGDWSEGWHNYALRRVVFAVQEEMNITEGKTAPILWRNLPVK
jgi:hypothetical protein